MTTKAMLWVMRTMAGRSSKRLSDEVLEEGRLEAARSAIEGPILVERGVEQHVGVGQRLAVDPLEQGDAAEGEDAGDDVEALDRLVIDEEQGEDGDVRGDEELPEEVHLRTDGQDGLDEGPLLERFGHP